MHASDEGMVRVEHEAARFEGVAKEVVAYLQQCSDEDWRRRCDDIGGEVGDLAQVILELYVLTADLIELMAWEHPIPSETWQALEEISASPGGVPAELDRAGVITQLRRTGDWTARRLRQLQPDQLDRTAPSPLMGGLPISVEELINMVLIGRSSGLLSCVRSIVAS